MNWQLLIPKDSMVVTQMLFMDDRSYWMVILLFDAITIMFLLVIKYLLMSSVFIFVLIRPSSLGAASSSRNLDVFGYKSFCCCKYVVLL